MKRLASLSLALALSTFGNGAQASSLNFEFSFEDGRGEFHGGLGNLGSFSGSFNGSFGGGGLFGSGLLGDLLGGLGHGGHLGHGLFGGGFLGLGADFAQDRFEDRFADIKADYDDGLANIENFYSSDEYDDVLDDMERLVDRYDWFVVGVERSIDHLGDSIESANDSLTYYEDLLAEYQGRDDLSERRLARIENWITAIQDGVQFKIDLLTERQDNLTADLPSYQSFQTELGGYLGEITEGGTGDVGGAATQSAIAATSSGAIPASIESEVAAAVSGVPEPTAFAMLLTAAAAIARRRRGESTPACRVK